MRLLLDTHALLWWLADEGLTPHAAREIARIENQVLVSAASAWEIAIKRSLGRLQAPDDLVEQISAAGFEDLSIDCRHAIVAGGLPPHHQDPFDRMLIAQAVVEGLTVVTRDPRFAAYQVALLAA
ncbi:MAG TPA: type II toxin-antitoxin system VapC family toxin [Candidatus Micrarchaeia archaeon]|nr:type II toxin-antitoxin system VapC family toxin [Candidatus Micrarchaeia archaeon]